MRAQSTNCELAHGKNLELPYVLQKCNQTEVWIKTKNIETTYENWIDHFEKILYIKVGVAHVSFAKQKWANHSGWARAEKHWSASKINSSGTAAPSVTWKSFTTTHCTNERVCCAPFRALRFFNTISAVLFHSTVIALHIIFTKLFSSVSHTIRAVRTFHQCVNANCVTLWNQISRLVHALPHRVKFGLTASVCFFRHYFVRTLCLVLVNDAVCAVAAVKTDLVVHTFCVDHGALEVHTVRNVCNVLDVSQVCVFCIISQVRVARQKSILAGSCSTPQIWKFSTFCGIKIMKIVQSVFRVFLNQTT